MPKKKNSPRAKAKAERQAAAQAAGKKPPGKPFVKGDPRINRAGSRIKGFYVLRQMAQQISEEPASAGTKQSLMEKTLRELISSPDPRAKSKFLEIAWGKVEDRVITSNFDMDAILEKVDLKKLTNEQLDELSQGKNIIEVLLGDYLK